MTPEERAEKIRRKLRPWADTFEASWLLTQRRHAAAPPREECEAMAQESMDNTEPERDWNQYREGYYQGAKMVRNKIRALKDKPEEN